MSACVYCNREDTPKERDGDGDDVCLAGHGCAVAQCRSVGCLRAAVLNDLCGPHARGLAVSRTRRERRERKDTP